MASANEYSIYHGCEVVVGTEYDRDSSDSLTSTLVDALASAAGVEPTELDPLYDTVDLDALEALVEPTSGPEASNGVYSFSHEAWNVFVCSDGRIKVCDRSRPVEPMPVFGATSS